MLLTAARSVFSEKGFDGARVDEIASRAGVNKALINYHFGSKNKLFLAIIEEFGKAFLDRLKHSLAQEDCPLTQLRLFVRTIGQLTSEYPELPRIFLVEASTGARHMEAPPPHGPAAVMILAGILKRGEQQGVLRVLNPVFAYFHIISSVAFFHITAGLRAKLTEMSPFGGAMPFSSQNQSLDEFIKFLEDQVIAGFSSQEGEGAES